ncbi:MAG TPA: hypothetical protein VG889_09580 [Rhizomicrobium sp.]|nr:hypothetical protein [Rhizomicrobium sp.]
MRLKQHAARMKTLAAMRELQRLRTEADAMKAAASLRARETALDEARLARDGDAGAWLEAVSTEALRPEIASLWSQRLLTREAEVRVAARDAKVAERERDRRNADHHAATLRRDTADGLSRAAWNEFARARDDRALQDALDIHASKGRKGR